MIRGTTAQFKFKLPYNYSDLVSVQITFWQPENNGSSADRPLPIIKYLNQCQRTNSPKELKVTLTQEETLRFSVKRKAYVQLRALGPENQSFASKKEMLTVYPIQGDDIIGGGDIPLPPPTPSQPDDWIILDGGDIE